MLGFLAFGQTSLNDYKYIIVPKRFDGFKKENQYQTSTMVKHYFAQKGYNVVYDDALPNDLNGNRCLGLLTALEDNSSMFSTKVALLLKDCNGATVMTTVEGKSKEKDFKEAYREAIKEAFRSFDSFSYSYIPKNDDSDQVNLNFKGDVKKLEKKKKEAKNHPKKEVSQESTVERQSFKDGAPIESEYEKANTVDAVVEEVVNTEEGPISSEVRKSSQQVDENTPEKIDGVLYAQELPNGYQLVDSTPKILLKLKKTSNSNYFLAEGAAGQGMVFSKDGKWYFEHYDNDGKLVSEELNIKF
ncbi:hypothetical protein ACEZ3G_02165 [Maribacter algicola]|uniref:Uncharacterized protein n=1 Tax=Meishania litoralis TaxID=3434685 RepID=A0ACC7LGH0_9FLAO